MDFLIRSVIVSSIVLLSAFLFYSLLEYIGNFNSVVRGILFYSYLIFLLVIFFQWIILPVLKIFVEQFQITDQEAARHIGGFFPSIGDKLLNILQLYNKYPEKHDLVDASIKQKTKDIQDIKFDRAISFSKNKKYIYYLAIPFVIVVLLGLSFPKVISDPTVRIINYKTDYKPIAPFNFVLNNPDLIAFKNEDYSIQVAIEGEVVPENVYLILGERRIKLISSNRTDYSYIIKKIDKNIDFEFEAAGFNSEKFELKVVNRPNIKNFNVELSYPAYLNRNHDRFSNIGSLEVPEGTRIQWQFQTLFTDSISIKFENGTDPINLQLSDNQLFTIDKRVHKSGSYELFLSNQYAQNKDKIIYQLEVIPDQYPKISVEQYIDTVLYDYMILGGNISDDYGFSDLRLFYKIKTASSLDKSGNYLYHKIDIDPLKTSQGFYYNWGLDSLLLNDSDQIEYYLEVRDNDGINGRKATRTGLYYFKIPDKEERKIDLEKSSQTAGNQIDKSLEMARELNENIEEIENRLKGKKQMNWQDQKLLEELIRDKEALDNEIIKLQDLNQANSLKLEKFNELDTDLIKKVDQLQRLMDELLDEETKKLFEELKRLLEEKKDLNVVKSLLEKINYQEDNFERELERTLELFKRMKFDIELDETIDEIDDLQDKQNELSEATQDRKSDLNSIKEEQQNLNESFNEIKESIEDLIDLNQDLAFPKPMENTFDQEKSIEESQNESLKHLEDRKRKNASQSQQNAAKSLEELSEAMKRMQASGEMSMMMEDYNSLRLIVDNLIKLSFSQEEIMVSFRSVNQSDPRFITLSQRQLSLKDDAKVIEDSLMALSKRVFQISSFVTREVTEMNKYMDESVMALRERKKAQALGKQQFSMTSMNNLALLLDDVLSAMQQQLAMAMGIPSQSMGKDKQPSMSELQKRLNEQISELKKSGKQGKSLSEELARLAAEQEEIRRKLREEEEKLNNMDGNSEKLDNIAGKMEQTEIDLVNKRLTEQLIERQEEILTRLLQAEESMREQELDKERESKTARQIERPVPPEFEEYLKLKEKEIELLRTVPPKLNPYYKKEVIEYFNRLETSYK
jgi:hypothetical protein